MGLGSALEPDWRENPEEGTKKGRRGSKPIRGRMIKTKWRSRFKTREKS